MIAAASAAGLPQQPARACASEPRAAGVSWHGIGRELVRMVDGRSGERLSELVEPGFALDPIGIDEAWGRRESTGRRTIVQGVERRPTEGGPVTHEAMPIDAITVFEDAVESIARAWPHAVLALGGGLDAAAVLMAWRERTGGWPAVVTVRTGHAPYDEVEVACRLTPYRERSPLSSVHGLVWS